MFKVPMKQKLSLSSLKENLKSRSNIFCSFWFPCFVFEMFIFASYRPFKESKKHKLFFAVQLLAMVMFVLRFTKIDIFLFISDDPSMWLIAVVKHKRLRLGQEKERRFCFECVYLHVRSWRDLVLQNTTTTAVGKV